MVTDTRTFIEMSVREPEIVQVQLEELITKVLGSLQTLERFKSISAEIDLDRAAPVILGDKREMESMLHQLLLNSFEATDPKNPYLRITSKTYPILPNRVQIEIFNTGIPIKKEELETLFSPFFSTKFYGTGFGLPIAELAVKKNYGKLELQSLPNKGTKIIVTLPSIEISG